MDVLKIYSDSDFENAVVPEGMILSFPALLDGKLVTRYKDSSGAFGTLAGGSIEGAVSGAPWGASNATIHYNS